MSEWDQVRLDTVATLRNGVNFLRSDSGFETPIVGVGDFVGKQSIDDVRGLSRVQTSTAVALDDLLAPGDLLFVRSNGSKALVGRCIVYRAESGAATFSGFTIRARVDPNVADPDYVSSAARSGLFRSHLSRLGGGSSISNLSQAALGSFSLPLPPLAEQRRIAEIFGTWDDAIERVAKRRAVAQRARVGFRRSVDSDAWVTLSEVLTEHKLRSVGSEPVHSVSVHRGIINQVEHLGRSFAAATTAHYNRVEPGDIVYTKSPTGDFPYGIVKKSRLEADAIVSPLYGVFRPRDEATGTLVEAYFESPLASVNYLEPLVQKGAKNTIAITNRRFLEGRIPMPEDSVRREALAGLLDQSRTELDLIDRQIELLREQKRGLMQKLLSGEIRVGESGGGAS